ncbi:MAG: DMT family transporter [Bacillota bacterium]|nr:DMT family transporter [Bacillota bacterium]
MLGILMSVVAGAAMSFQGVINTRLSEKIGLYESNAFVQGTAFVLGLLALWILGKGDFSQMGQVSKVYWLGGVLGLIITITVMLAIGNLSPTYAISVILISQLLVAALIDAFGLLGSEKVPFIWTKYLGLALMIAGVVAFKWEKTG